MFVSSSMIAGCRMALSRKAVSCFTLRVMVEFGNDQREIISE
jgi:hypothetical protein